MSDVVRYRAPFGYRVGALALFTFYAILAVFLMGVAVYDGQPAGVVAAWAVACSVPVGWLALLSFLPGHLEPFAAMDGHLYPLASRLDDPGLHNIWFRDKRHGRWVLQLNIEAGDRAAWRYCRDTRIALPWDLAVCDIAGIPTGSPAVQLLWKSPQPRPQDDADLPLALALMPDAERHWLAEAIQTAHPSSPWIPRGRRNTRNAAMRLLTVSLDTGWV